MSDHLRRGLTLGASKKRKEREGFDVPKAPITTKAEPRKVAAAPPANNRLLAGYLAHEFLTKGTLFGQQWDSARSNPVRVAGSSEPEPTKLPSAYADVAYLLKTDGAHIPGIVNPTQLGRWLQSERGPAGQHTA